MRAVVVQYKQTVLGRRVRLADCTRFLRKRNGPVGTYDGRAYTRAGVPVRYYGRSAKKNNNNKKTRRAERGLGHVGEPVTYYLKIRVVLRDARGGVNQFRTGSFCSIYAFPFVR